MGGGERFVILADGHLDIFAAEMAKSFRGTPVAASTSSASWPPPSLAATSITSGECIPIRTCV